MIKIKKLNFNYGDKKILENVNLELKSGIVYGMVGRNGAGKTTLMKLIMNFLIPTESEVLKNNIEKIYASAELTLPKYLKHQKIVKELLWIMSDNKEEIKKGR